MALNPQGPVALEAMVKKRNKSLTDSAYPCKLAETPQPLEGSLPRRKPFWLRIILLLSGDPSVTSPLKTHQ